MNLPRSAKAGRPHGVNVLRSIHNQSFCVMQFSHSQHRVGVFDAFVMADRRLRDLTPCERCRQSVMVLVEADGLDRVIALNYQPLYRPCQGHPPKSISSQDQLLVYRTRNHLTPMPADLSGMCWKYCCPFMARKREEINGCCERNKRLGLPGSK